MRESCTPGSVRGAPGNGWPYRDCRECTTMESASEKPMCACGSQGFDRVVVQRVEAEPYVTEFVACQHCRAMYHRPRVTSRVIDPAGPMVDDWAARYRKSVKR